MQVELFWDVASPYTYLAHTQMPGLAERTGAEVRYRPMLLGGIFKATGNSMPGAVPAKAAYMERDLARWRDLYGVSFRLPIREVVFPVRSVLPMRVATVLEQQGRGRAGADALLTAYWSQGRDPSEPGELEAILMGLGEDPAAVLSAAERPETKAALRASTDEAVERGAFGAPTLFVGEEMFWGNDRLAFVEAALHRA